MTETRASYTSSTLTAWVPGLQGPQPQPEEVTVNGVKYRRVRECRECKWWEQFKDALPKGVDWGGCKLAQQAGAAIESDGATSYDGFYEPSTNTRADFGCNQWAPKE